MTLFISFLISTAAAAPDPKVCEKGLTIAKGDAVFAYTKSDKLYPLAFLSGSKLKSAAGFYPKHQLSFVDVEGKNSVATKLEPAQIDSHSGNCIFARQLPTGKKISGIVASRKIAFKIPIPTASQSKFKEIKSKCVNHGDDVPQKCLYPQLLAISDLDNNGREEFWFEQPYMWDIGVSVAEISIDGKELVNLVEDCSLCAD